MIKILLAVTGSFLRLRVPRVRRTGVISNVEVSLGELTYHINSVTDIKTLLVGETDRNRSETVKPRTRDLDRPLGIQSPDAAMQPAGRKHAPDLGYI